MPLTNEDRAKGGRNSRSNRWGNTTKEERRAFMRSIQRPKGIDKNENKSYNSNDKGALVSKVPAVKSVSWLLALLRDEGILSEAKLVSILARRKRQAIVSNRRFTLGRADKKTLDAYLTRYRHCALYTKADGKGISFVTPKKLLPWPFTKRGGIENVRIGKRLHVLEGRQLKRIQKARPESNNIPAAITPGGSYVGASEGAGNTDRLERGQETREWAGTLDSGGR